MDFKNNSKLFFKHIVASTLLVAGFALPAQAIDVVMSGTSEAGNQPLIDFIAGNFQDVNLTFGDFSNYAANAAVIESSDLFIVGRVLSSNAYADATNSASFDALTVPVVAFTSYVTRPLDGRWGWHDGDVAAGLSFAGDETTVTAAGASAFGVAAGANDWFPETGDTFNAAGAGSIGDGEILATIAGGDNILAAHWNAGDMSGTGATFGSDRLLFNFTEVTGPNTAVLPNAAGQQALINALTAFTPLTLPTANQWDVDGGGSFNEPGNWTDNVVPTQDPLFGGGLTSANAPATVTLDSPVSLNSVSFQNPNQYILAGPETLTLTGDREVSTVAGTHQITANIAGAAGLVKTGAGTLVLPSANSYTGATDVQGGTLNLNTLDAIDNQASSTLNIESEAESVVLAPGATGTLAAELTGLGTLQLSADLEPTDTIALNRSNASFDGLIDVDNGTLEVTHDDALGDGDLSVNLTRVAGNESTGKVALSDNVTIDNEVLALGARELAGFDEVHLTSAGSNTWGGDVVGEVGGSQYNIESTSGTLTLGGTISAPDTNPRNFVFSGAGDTTITGGLSDAVIDVDTGGVTSSENNNVSVVKRGAGTLTVATGTDNVNDFWLGPTVIEEGALAVTAGAGDAGELHSLDVTIREGATLDISSFGEYSQQIGQAFRGAGTINAGSGTLALFDDSPLAPGDGTGQTGVLNVTGNVSLSAVAGAGDEGTWSFDLGNNTETSSDMLAVSGEFTPSGSPALLVNVTPARGHLDAGAHTIVSHSGGSVAAVNGMTAQITDVQGNPLTTRQSVAVNGDTAGQVNVVVTGEEATRTWNGNTSGAWDVATTNNWQEGDQQYQDFDRVTFDDTASGTTNVTVDGPRHASAVTFANSSKDYTLSGSGGVTGSGSVSVTGTGQVTLANTGNNYSGSTTIASGSSLRMTSATTGAINNSGSLSLGVPVTVDALEQDGSVEIGGHKVFAVEAEDFTANTVNTTDVVSWEVISDDDANGGMTLATDAAGENNLDTNVATTNFATYSMRFTEPGTYYWFGRSKGETASFVDDSFWLPATDLGEGVTDPQELSTRADQFGNLRNAEGLGTEGDEASGSVFDWYRSDEGELGGLDGFEKIVVTQGDVDNSTVFQFKVGSRESGARLDKHVFVQDAEFTGAEFPADITDALLDGVATVSTTSSVSFISAGNVLNVDGDFTMDGDDSSLDLQLGTTDIHDQVNISGTLFADGELNVVSGDGGLSAQAGDVFDVFIFESASGEFDDVTLPALAGALDWDTSNLLVTGELSVVSTALPGDFNGDGLVDARDYALWRDNLGAADESALNGAGDGMNGVDSGDYALWRSNFGAGSGGAAGTQPVPEPGAIVLLPICAALAVLRTRRR